MIRRAAVGASLAALAVVLGRAVAGLVPFGRFDGAYGRIANDLILSRDRITQVVSGVTYDMRSFDTLGEVFILFAALLGTMLLLRGRREHPPEEARDRTDAETIRLLGLGAAPLLVTIGLWDGSTATLSPGGGFQVGVVLAGGALLVWAAGGYRSYLRATPVPLIDAVEGVGAGGVVAIGLAALATTGVFLHLIAGHGPFGTLRSGGSVILVSWSAALEVAAANVLIFHEFLKEYVSAVAR